jgi:hypothetical protein
LRNYPRVRFGFSGSDNITAANATNMKRRKPNPKKRENNTPKKLQQLDQQGSCAYSETFDSKMY